MKALRSVVSLAFCLTLTACPGMADLLAQYGFAEALPPSTIFAPGAIVAVRSTRPFTATVVCSQTESLGNAFVPMETAAPDGLLQYTNGAEIPLSVKLQDQIRTDVRFKAIQTVTAELKDATVDSATHASIYDHVDQRSRGCLAAIAAQQKAGKSITMISAALKADTTYHIAFKTNVDVSLDAKIQAVKDLAIVLNLAYPTVTETTLHATGLYWGVQDDPNLVTVGSEGGTGGGTGDGTTGGNP